MSDRLTTIEQVRKAVRQHKKDTREPYEGKEDNWSSFEKVHWRVLDEMLESIENLQAELKEQAE
jgi:hypothetical protein